MNGLTLLVAMVAFAQVPEVTPVASAPSSIQFGWSLEADGKIAYIIHVPPAAVNTMLTTGDELESNMPSELVGLVSRIVVRISEAAPERSPTLEKLGEMQKQAMRARSSTLPGNALATLAGKTSPTIAQIDNDRDRDAPVQTAANPPGFQTPFNPASSPFTGGSGAGFGTPTPNTSGNLSDFRDRDLATDPSSLSSSFGNPGGNPSSLTVGNESTSAQQPIITPALPPSQRNPPLLNNLNNAASNFGNGQVAGSNLGSINNAFPGSNPQGMNGNRPTSGGAVGQGFDAFNNNRNPNQMGNSNDTTFVADNRQQGGAIPRPPQGGFAAGSDKSQADVSPGDLQGGRQQAATTGSQPEQRDRLLPILFMLSFVANVYMAILLSKLVGRYRSLLVTVRSGMPGFEGSMQA
jgi:hypothetical protein